MGRSRVCPALSDLEARLILRLEWERQPVVTIEETLGILDRSYDHVQVRHRPVRSRRLMPLRPGKCELTPADARSVSRKRAGRVPCR
jgi:hypothetical protein